tara:strand:+ start:2114 stop:4354 length:2241 start_codon:yes stop_codon:yes gene_type:complete
MRKKNKNILKNPVLWIIVIFLVGLTVSLIIYFTNKTAGSKGSGPPWNVKKWPRWKDTDKDYCDKNPDVCSDFLKQQMIANGSWVPATSTSDGYVQVASKVGVAALCPYGQYFDPTATSKQGNTKGDCISWTANCTNGETSSAGFCDKDYVKPVTQPSPDRSIEVWDGTDNVFLKIPEITLTWYAFSGKAKRSPTDTLAKGYVKLIVDFCSKAGIKNLAVPFTVPDKNNKPWVINGGQGGPIPDDNTKQWNNATSWLRINVLDYAASVSPPVSIGLNVYANYKDSQWIQWSDGAQNIEHKLPECQVGDLGTGGKLSYMGCAWPPICKFINDINTDQKQGAKVTFTQTDAEWGNFGDISAAATYMENNCKGVKFTMAGSLKLPGNHNPPMYSVPEVYWDAGNEFPCSGGADTYTYTNRACTTSTSHRLHKNRPKAFYQGIAGDGNMYGSDKWNESKTSSAEGLMSNGPWLNSNNFKFMNDNIRDKDNGSYVLPSFTIENLSMCSGTQPDGSTNDIVIKEGASGGKRWVCVNSLTKAELPPDKTDCASLLYYGKGIVADMKVCGVLDGFSHWDWHAMQQFLAYFAHKSMSNVTNPHVVIYEAQFIPTSWFDAVLPANWQADTKYAIQKGTKRTAAALPTGCVKDNDCGNKSYMKCTSGVCVNSCINLVDSDNKPIACVPPPGPTSSSTPTECNKYWKELGCPFGGKEGDQVWGYCKPDNPSSATAKVATTGTCHYNELKTSTYDFDGIF